MARPPRPPLSFFKTLRSRAKDYLLVICLLLVIYLLYHQPLHAPLSQRTQPLPVFSRAATTNLTRNHLLFSIASSSNSLPGRLPYIRLWFSTYSTRAVAFLDRVPPKPSPSSPPIIISGDTSCFPYTFLKGHRSAIRLARVVKEAVDLNLSDVRWFVFGDDDTVFFVDNLVMTLAKYDHERWFYVGANSESYEQNAKNSFDMAFGGGGFAISASLARVLARVLDSCLFRYSHLYGSDSRVFSCLGELGVGLTHEPGFHQVDMRGNLFGMLSAHPLSPLVSLHHLDSVDPIFPNMNRTQALEHLFKAVNADPARVLQQTVCYDRSNNFTVSVSWGYAIQVLEGNVLLPDLLLLQRTFMPWKRGRNNDAATYMFNTRDYPRDPCKRPTVFFLESVISDETGVQSNYVNQIVGDCPKRIKNLEKIRVLSHQLELGIEQMKAPCRQCCDISPSNESMVINIRQCGVDELISMFV
ncbi:DUF604 domain-containing protein [Cephalotus follicularis]|uniref:DUF604 domain-containing protein n=1 Tax=Cephalotus follicularis TaxID=3775 RepID=A0A1Q3CIS2_CEPFO|nr:DUF604 domain-containing protein [Cephalotus follicularis]